MELLAEELLFQDFISCMVHISPKFGNNVLHMVDS